jgi:hypothetical protein
MNTYTLLAPSELLRSCGQQVTSNQGDINSSVTRKVGRVHYTGGTVSDLISLPYHTIFLIAF